MKKKIFLASTSPRRQALIHSLGLPLEIIRNDVDETINLNRTPEDVVQELASRKANGALQKLENKNDNGIIVGGDTVVVLNNEILGKPKDEEHAFELLKSLQGKVHTVYSGLACIDIETKQQVIQYKATKVKMKSLTDSKINNYIKTGEPMDKAGAYGIQGIGATLVEAIEGDYFNVVGLSVSLLSDMLEELGVHVL